MFREHLLLKAGVIMMAIALALTAIAVVVTLVPREGPVERVAVSEAVAETISSAPPARTAPPPSEPEPTTPGPVEEAKEPQPAAEPAPKPPPPPPPEPEKEAASEPRPEPPQPEPERFPEVLPASEGEWEKPTQRELQAANAPRHYELPPGAIMALTIKKMNIHNVPVFDSDGEQALANGIAHVPETSLPWSPTPQRNVFLAGHRMGYRGTWSRMVFYHLDKLANGDEILLRDRAGNTYRYRVSDIFLARPVDSWVMGQVRGKDMVTLQTCTPVPTFDKRLIIRANRV